MAIISNNYDVISEFIFDKVLKLMFTFPKELSGTNIFYGNYFPFNTSLMND